MIDSISLSEIIVSLISASGAVAAAFISAWISRRNPRTASGDLTVTRRRYLLAWRLVAALSLLLAVLMAVQIHQGITRKPVSVEIRTPTEYEPVDGQKYGGLDATVRSVPPGFEITIVVYDVNSRKYTRRTSSVN